MPFKIYTYTDPYKLDKCDFWLEIKSLPHLCGAQTLANAVRDLYGPDLRALICPIDNLVKHAYSDWFGNVHRELRQYGALTEMFSTSLRNREIDHNTYNSFRHSKRDVLQAIRLFVELGINPSKLVNSHIPTEQRYFIELLQLANAGPAAEAFTLVELNDLNSLQLAFAATLEYEREARLKRLKGWLQQALNKQDQESVAQANRILAESEQLYDDLKVMFKSCPRKVVIHGIHQFTPLQLRLVQRMDELGVDIIFMFNYQAQHAAIYSTWQRVYRPFGVVPMADSCVTHYTPGVNRRSNDLAVAMASLFEGPSSKRAALYHLGTIDADPLFVEFDNTTEFANYVSEFFLEAQELDEHNPLSIMGEQVYSASRAVHEILRVCHPEYAGDRHLLAYPVGQFFVALYKMWNHEKKQLVLDKRSLSECLGAGLLRSGTGEQLLRIHHVAHICYEDAKTFSDFTERMALYTARYKEVYGEPAFPSQIALRRLSIYDEELLSLKDLDMLLAAVTELNSLAVSLFSPVDAAGEHILLKRHFERIEEFIEQGLTSLAHEEEATLIRELLDRLNSMKFEVDVPSTIDDLRDGIHFYLRQQERESERWIVRNFEQIDGDILRSRAQHRAAIDKTSPNIVYHFASLSDKDMNKTTDDLLPWPLTDRFIGEAYFPVDTVFQVYHTSLSEYSQFLRYALFYGLCYNDCDVRLSYVKNEGRESTQPYFALQCLGINPHPKSFKLSPKGIVPLKAPPSPVPSAAFRAVHTHGMAFYLCPYRYFLDYILEKHPTLSDKFSMSAFYVNLLVRYGWTKVAEKQFHAASKALRGELVRINETIVKYFPYLRNVNDSYDLISQAENYIIHNLRDGTRYRRYDESHMEVRLLYKKAVYRVDADKWRHPDKYCNSLVSTENGKVKASVYRVQKAVQPELQNAMQAYLGQATKWAHPAEWCHYCPHKTLCLETYTAESTE